MTTSEPQSSRRNGPRGPIDWSNALLSPAAIDQPAPVVPTGSANSESTEFPLSAPIDASTDELAVAAQYLLAHVQGNQDVKDVLMRTAGPMELTAGLTVLTCLIIDQLTGGTQDGVEAVVAHACAASTAYHRDDLGLGVL